MAARHTGDGSLITFVDSPGIGRIAVVIKTPRQPRYPAGAPVVVSSSGFFMPYNPEMASKNLDTNAWWLENSAYPEGVPFFAVPGGSDYVLARMSPQMWGKRYYSAALTLALLNNGAPERR